MATATTHEVQGAAEEDEEHHPLAAAATNEDDDDSGGVTFFEEHAECAAILTDAAEALAISWERVVANSDPTVASLALFEKYLQRYQEYPQLIKHHLGALVEPLMAMVVARMPGSTTLAQLRGNATTTDEGAGSAAAPVSQMPEGYDEFDVDAPRTPLHHICRCLYVVVKVAGPKSCTSFFSHDVRMFEDVCYALMHWHSIPSLHREWEVRYCLILWLCNLILVPFAIHSIDSALSDSGMPLSQQLLRLSFEFLKDTSRCREAAALLIARLMSRADGAAHREEFFGNVQQWLVDKDISSVQLDGVLQALATTLKLAKRRELLKYVAPLIPLVCVVAEERHADTKLCKAALKVTQRLGLCLLKQQTAPWRYMKAVGSLEDNLLVSSNDAGSMVASSQARSNGVQGGDDDADETAECEGEGLEEVIGLLIQNLSHPDTVVRWSAAKGIGRLCNRLPKAMADDVVDAFTEVFQVRENDSGWHGGMLALAELCRRSILLPSRFQATVETVALGLMYDVSRGTYSVGSHVRDAACYVCWSVARAYNAVDLEPYVHQLSTTLAIASLFDREVNVRRAASAALQECVGRLGNFPNGIDLVTTMDFFSLATMRGAYLSVAPQVGMYPAYWPSMVGALVDVKLVHWDKDVRRTAAKSLGLLAARNPTHIVQLVEQQLLPRVKELTLALRHGAIFGIAECVAGLPPSSWSNTTVAAIANIVPYLESSRQFRGRGGEYVRHACCRLLEAAAQSGLVLPEFVEVEKVSGEKGKARTLGKLQVFYEDSWKQILEWVQLEAVNSYRSFASAYYTTFQEGFHTKVVSQMVDACAEGGASMVRRGSVLALGALPLPLLRAEPSAAPSTSAATASPSGDASLLGATYYHLALDVLCKAAIPEANPEVRDAETRRNAVMALVLLTTSLPPQDADRLVTDACWRKIVRVLADAFNDYAVDKRGDVGSYVRVQAMQSTVALMHWAARTTDASCAACIRQNAKEALVLIGLTLQQSIEKIDKVRGVGGQAMHDMMCDAPTVALLNDAAAQIASSSSGDHYGQGEIPLLVDVFVASGIADWSSPTEVFPLVVPKLLQTHLFAEYVMEGLVVSVGGLSVHVLRPSFDALVQAFTTAGDDVVGRLSFLLVKVAAKHVHDDRFVVPLCITVDRLINAGLFDNDRLGDLVDVVVSETKHFSTDIQKLLPLVGVLGTLCRAPAAEARTAAWMHALQMIASRYPKVRAKMGTDLYTALLFLSSSVDDTTGQAGLLPDAASLQCAMDRIASTTWDDTNATAVRGARNELYPMLALRPPVKDGTGGMASKPVATNKGKNTSYSHLVHEAGY